LPWFAEFYKPVSSLQLSPRIKVAAKKQRVELTLKNHHLPDKQFNVAANTIN